MRHFNSALYVCLLAGITCVTATNSPGQQLPAAGEKPVAAVATLAVGSATQIADVASDLGVPLPAMLTAGGVEQMFSFLGQGGLNPNLPIGVDILAGGSDLTQAQRSIVYLPVNAGHAPIGDFIARGEKLGPDGALVNNTPFRRTDDYLLFGGTSSAILPVKTADLLNRLTDHPLFYLELNAKKFRDIEPAMLENFKQQLKENTPKAANSAEQAGQDLVTNAMFDGFDKLSFQLSKQEGAFRLSTRIEPFNQLPSKSWTLPGMPDDLIARADVQMPRGWVKPTFEWLRKIEGDAELFKEVDAPTPERKQQYIDCVANGLDMIFCGDQASYGVGVTDGEVVIYIETQSNSPRKGHEEWKALAEQLNSFNPANQHAGDVRLVQYDSATGDKIDRLISGVEDGATAIYIDSVDRQGMRFTTMSRKKSVAIEKLLSAANGSTSSVSASGWFDLHQLVAATSSVSALKGQLSDEDRALLDKVIDKQRISWSADDRQGQLSLAVDLPIALLKNSIANQKELSDLARRVSNKGN